MRARHIGRGSGRWSAGPLSIEQSRADRARSKKNKSNGKTISSHTHNQACVNRHYQPHNRPPSSVAIAGQVSRAAGSFPRSPPSWWANNRIVSYCRHQDAWQETEGPPRYRWEALVFFHWYSVHLFCLYHWHCIVGSTISLINGVGYRLSDGLDCYKGGLSSLIKTKIRSGSWEKTVIQHFFEAWA